MNDRLHKLRRRYTAALGRYLANRHEAVLEQAYELGRLAIAQKLGVLDMVRVHGDAVGERLHRLSKAADCQRVLRGAENFFLEALSPFEATHRGFQETNTRLQHLIQTLEENNAHLARINRELGHEIRERQRTEKALQASEARLQAILANSPAMIFMKDTRGRYLHVNREFERLFGLDRDDVVGRTDDELFPRQQAAKFQANDRVVLRAGGPMEFEEVARYRGEVHISIVSKFPLRDAKGRVYALCGIVTDITERKRAEHALQQSELHYRQLFNEAQIMQENLRRLSNKVLHAQEEERKRISRELHDEIGQALTAVSVTFATLKHNGAAKSGIIRRQLSDSECLLQETMERVHCFARELRPAMLDELGLLPALRSHLNGFARRTGLHVHFRGSADAENLGSDQKTVLFRVAQESLTNVAKHARARRVHVDIRRIGGGICLEVKDDGQSFQEKPETSNHGVGRLGLLGMQERARLVNGTLTIRAQPGKGTTIRVVIPFTSSSRRIRVPSGKRRTKRSHPSRRSYAKNPSRPG